MSELIQRIAKLSPEKRALLERHLSAKAVAPTRAQGIARRQASEPAVLSFGQQRLWFLEQLEPGGALSIVPSATRIEGALDVDALTRAFDAIVSRHEVLRTTFATIEGEPVAVIAPERRFELPIKDLSLWPEEEREAEVERLIQVERGRPFDLSRDLPIRAFLLRLRPEQHVLVMANHHIASDAWSSGVFRRELEALYDAYVHDTPSPLPDLPIQYADFARWQREHLKGPLLETQLAYWKAKLAGLPSSLDLPTDRPRPVIQSSHGGEETLLLPHELVEALTALSRAEGATLFMALLACFKVLLHRYSGQSDIVVGTPVAGRQRVETEGLIGLFLNNLVLRTDLSGEPTFRELLRRVRATAVEAYAHQDLPFERLVEELRVERNLSHTPLFQVMLNLRNTPRPPLRLNGLTLSPLEVESRVAKHDLTLATTEQRDGLQLELEYNSDLYDRATITRMLTHLRTLIDSAIANPDQPIGLMSLLPDDERRQILHGWNQTAAPFPTDRSLVQLFEAQVEINPTAIAFVGQGTSICYGELNRRANRLAAYLQSRGVGPEVVVGLCLERSVDAAVGLLAILKAGGAYLPLDPSYPAARLRYMLEDSRAPIVITTKRLAATLNSDAGTQVICLDMIQVPIELQHVGNLGAVTSSNALAYIIYTSGSTGEPKGVAVEHGAILNRFEWMWRTYPFGPADVGCQKTALSFVDSIWELLGPLLQGVPSVILRDETVRDPHLLVAQLAEHGVTRLWLVPSLLQVLLETFPDLQRRLPRLGMWVTTGEAITPEIYERFRIQMPHSRLYNLYGASEASSMTWHEPGDKVSNLQRVPIGRPIANTQAYILDRRLQPVPIGIPGELCVGGVGVGRGYVNRPDLSAERFLSHPFRADGERFYKTGDRARFLADGTIEYLGRDDQQVKIRGFRVEPGEIESVIRRYPDVQHAVVLCRNDAGDEPRLIAYVKTTGQTAVSEGNLRQFLKTQLPDYMLPASFISLDSVPLTASGKVDRRALPAGEPATAAGTHVSTPPQDPLELQLKLLWESTLGHKGIGIHDDFFDLGGHSLLAVRLFAQIEDRLGRRLPLSAIFQARTIEELARLLREEGWSAPWSTLVAIQPGGSKRPFFWVPAAGKTALSFVHLARHLGPDQPVYAFQPLGVEGECQPQTSVEEMAAHYLQEMRLLQPEGPYLLGGRCFGSAVAFEMARQLRAANEEIALLALVDGGPPMAGLRAPAPPHQWLGRTVYHWRRGMLPGILRFHIRHKAQSVRRRVEKPILNIVGSREAVALRRLLDAHLVARGRYTGQQYEGKGTLFWSSEFFALFGEKWKRGWEQLFAEGIDSYVVQGRHRPLLQEPDVEPFAAQLRSVIDTLPS